MLAQTFAIVAAAALAAAAPAKRQTTDGEPCVFELAPSTTLTIGSLPWVSETNYMFGNYLFQSTGNFISYKSNDAKFNEVTQIVNGTFSASVNSVSDVEVATLMEELNGQTLYSSPEWPGIEWSVQKVDCLSV